MIAHKLLKKLTTSCSRSHDTGGTGLGLYIKSIIEKKEPLSTCLYQSNNFYN